MSSAGRGPGQLWGRSRMYFDVQLLPDKGGRFRLTWGIIKYQPHDPPTNQGRSMEGIIESNMGVKSHAHWVDISHSSILLHVCSANAKGEASNQPNRPRVLEAVEGVLVLKAPAFTFLFADGILRCSRRGCAILACCRGEAEGNDVRMLKIAPNTRIESVPRILPTGPNVTTSVRSYGYHQHAVCPTGASSPSAAR
jgi:hypothetical protein